MITMVKTLQNVNAWSLAFCTLLTLFGCGDPGSQAGGRGEGRQRLLPSQFYDTGRADLYVINSDGKYGFIDKTGDVVIASEFDQAHNFSSGLALVVKTNEQFFINREGEAAIPPRLGWEYRPFSEGFAATRIGKKWGYVDTTGSLAIPVQFDDALPFLDGRARVVKGTKAGFIDKSGRLVIQAQFDEATDFRGGYARVVRDGQVMFVDRLGNITRFEGVEWALPFSSGFAALKIRNRWGYGLGDGRIAIKPRFELAGQFREGFAAVVENGKMGFIDREGNVVIPFVFSVPAVESGDDLPHFSQGLAPVLFGDKWGYVNNQGLTVIAPQFAEAHAFSHGLAMVKTMTVASKSGPYYGPFVMEAYIDRSGNQVWPTQ